MNLCGRDCRSCGVPVKCSDGPSLSSEILKAVLFWRHLIATLVLRHFYLPLPGGGRGAGININVNRVACIGCWDIQVLSSVVATYNWWRGPARVGHCEGVIETVTKLGTISSSCGGGVRTFQDQGVKVDPQLAHVCVLFADSVSTRVGIRAG